MSLSYLSHSRIDADGRVELAGVRSPRVGRKPAHWTRVDRDYEQIRIDMQTLFTDLAIETPLAA
jgi:hypothetical protein